MMFGLDVVDAETVAGAGAVAGTEEGVGSGVSVERACFLDTTAGAACAKAEAGAAAAGAIPAGVQLVRKSKKVTQVMSLFI